MIAQMEKPAEKVQKGFNPFEMAQRQLDEAAELLQLDPAVHELLRGVPVLAAHPGVFTFGGTSRAVALNQDNSLNSPDNPIPRGQVTTLFATGHTVPLANTRSRADPHLCLDLLVSQQLRRPCMAACVPLARTS